MATLLLAVVEQCARASLCMSAGSAFDQSSSDADVHHQVGSAD